MYIDKKIKLAINQENELKKLKIHNKKLHEEILEIMKVTRDVFEKAGIDITLFGGTLLGSHLYKGFIPWDDDADFAAFYSDKQKIIELIPPLLPEGYELLSPELNSNYLYTFLKIIKKDTPLPQKEFGERDEFAFPWIDITLLSEPNKIKRNFGVQFWGKILWMHNASVSPFINFLMKLVTPFKSSYIVKKTYKSFEKNNGGNIVTEMNPYAHDVYANIDFRPKILVEFEGLKFPAFKDNKEYFKQRYESGKKWKNGAKPSIYNVPSKLIIHTKKR